MERRDIINRRDELAASLLQKRNPEGFWDGRLSSSALAVAVAITALHFGDRKKNEINIRRGTVWLISNQNTDGGYGDTPGSLSNISTSMLTYSAFNIIENQETGLPEARAKLSAYLLKSGIDVNSPSLADAVLKFYRKDRTFSVPILTMCALCSVPSEGGFKKIPQLPFELSLLPRSFYRMLNLSVVSYAIPALIGVGIAIFTFKPGKSIFINLLRRKAIAPSLRLLHVLMPESGGFLEAIPLTGFVSICLIASGYGDIEVVKRGLEFLKSSQRTDGSWAIDIDLSTWVTTLSVKALRDQINKEGAGDLITDHLLACQNTSVHPFNGALPGGWGWTVHSGSVPDGDDTPGAIIALLILNKNDPEKIRSRIINGCNWLLVLQNNDGGFPTFVRGWGKLPFDMSCADLTGHALLALAMTLNTYADLDQALRKKYLRTIRRGVDYLVKNQNTNGSLLPLWFGNQMTEDHHNPVYGTARVVSYLRDMAAMNVPGSDLREKISAIIRKGQEYLLTAQNPDGSWGGDTGISGSIEETALSLGAIAGHSENFPADPANWRRLFIKFPRRSVRLPENFSENAEACMAAITWLDKEYNNHGLKASPIGLYFASLWYDEVLYPHAAYLEGLSGYLREKPE